MTFMGKIFFEPKQKRLKDFFSGSILVFLPGYEDILAVREKAIKMQGCSTKPAIFTLHSQMGSQDQQRVFEPVGRGYRKVVLLKLHYLTRLTVLYDGL